MLTSPSFDALTGTQRAAVLVVALGVETASQLLPALDDDEVERLTVEVARLDRVPAALVADVLVAFQAAASTAAPVEAAGGLDAARALLGGLDDDRAGAIRPRLEAATEGAGFDLLKSVPAEDLASFLADEHPQAAAVILSQLPARAAAATLEHLPTDTQGEVIRRLSTLTTPPASALSALDAALRQHFGARRAPRENGVKRVANILTQAGEATGQLILGDLHTRTPELATQIEELLFVFGDLVTLQPRQLAVLLSRVEQPVLACALVGSDEAFKAKVFENVSERVRDGIREEIEMLGSAPKAEVEVARRIVVGMVLEMADAGELSLEPAEPVEA
ncbi:flagellar motor switch protein FliG [Rubrivirga sp. IMCC45206]|uniref:flagellar motor switch protein FliG n=1 Tax=Rubrivirga sp. IMCC45206 TaxID=3391614 RepID=UPI00398FC8C1